MQRSTTSADPDAQARGLSVDVAGQAKSRLLVITFLLCVVLSFVNERPEFHVVWSKMPLRLTPLTRAGSLFGVVKSAAQGWYFALVVVPLYNWAARR